MIKRIEHGVFYKNGALVEADPSLSASARKLTMAYSILEKHNTSGNMERLKIKFDAMASHDITYVGIIQTARASGLKEFPLSYVLTNCHNSLCAVGGTINEDDHVFGLSAAKKYGGEFVPAHQSVIHQYMRERYAGCGKMILASDSHTRYGALGTLSVGEGGGELSKQLLGRTWDLAYPQVVAVCLKGKPQPGVGPQDVALALIGATFADGFVKNKILEFVGDGIKHLGMDYRNGIDVMTTETSCLSSVWMTDETVKEFLTKHGRVNEYKPLAPQDGAYYDSAVEIDLSKVEPMIALPFHPSNVYTIADLKANAADILASVDKATAEQFELPKGTPTLLSKLTSDGIRVDQGVIAGCSGGLYQNLCRAAEILKNTSVGVDEFWLSVYPSSTPIMLALIRNGALADLTSAGASIRSAFCGPCFGAGDVPANGALSIRHSTRNFPNREGSKPGNGQISYVALMDARSIAATAKNHGLLTAATELDKIPAEPETDDYIYDPTPYQSRVYHGFGKADPSQPLVFGPNIADWPEMPAMPEDLELEIASAIYDDVTTTDELIPSGETSSYRSNPMKLAEFALSRKDPGYVTRAKRIHAEGLASAVFAVKPGDGSAREQAASCQRVLGAAANIACEYATKRYRSNLVNWGMIPFICENGKEIGFATGDRVFIPGVRAYLEGDGEEIAAILTRDNVKKEIILKTPGMTREERDIVLAGCLINYYKNQK